VNAEILRTRPGRHLNQVFTPIQRNETGSGIVFAHTARGALIVDGLMRQARVKANGDEIVAALNLTHALGWACSRQQSSTRDALRDLFVEIFDVTQNAAEIGATLVCDRLKISGNTLIQNDPDLFLAIAREYQSYPLGIVEDLHTGVLLDQ